MDLIYVGGKIKTCKYEWLLITYDSRYDSQSHRLTDYPAEGHAHEIFPGQDYSNPRVKDFQSGNKKVSMNKTKILIFNLVAQYDLSLVDRNITPRMPWHDMTVGMVIKNYIQLVYMLIF